MRKLISFVFFSFIFISFSFSELMTSEKYGYTIDFPECFQMAEGTEDESMYLFNNPFFPVQALIKATDSSKSADEFLRNNLKKLNATLKGDKIETVNWRRRKTFFASFTMQNQIFTEMQQGIAVSVPLKSKSSFVSLIVFAPKKNFYQYECFISSIIDSLVVDFGGFKESGIITNQKYPINEKNILPVELSICGEKISTSINKIDALANQYVIDREFNVFKFYGATNNPKIFEFAIPAWQRFYRMIAKDSLSRLKKCAFDINNALQDLAFEKDSKNPDSAVAQMLLNWIQQFDYQRESNDASKADFKNLPSVLQNLGSDCDSRSLLLAVLLKIMGMDTCIFVSSEYSHALLGVVMDEKKGQFIELETINGKKKYLLGDTTVRDLTFGTIAASQADKTKWIEVEFAF